jgi:hemoglobin/transferrin/lactoferrin receptor protein
MITNPRLNLSINKIAIALGISVLAAGPALFGQSGPTPQEHPPANSKKAADIAVTVEASPAERSMGEIPGSFTVITADAFERQGVANLGDVVRYEPLVNAPKAATGSGNIWDGSGYTGYNIRGIEGNRVSLELDGVPQPDAAPKPDGGTLNSFGIGRDYTDIEMYRSVEIGSGTTSSSRGTPGLAGGVSFTTKSPSDFLGRSGRPYYVGYKASYASADESFANTFTGAAEHGPAQALVIYTHRDGQETETNGSTPPNPIDWQSDAVLTKLVWKNDGGHELEFSLDYFRRDMDIVALNKISTSYPEAVRQDSLAERFTLGATHRFTPTNPLPLFDTVVTKLYYQDAVTDDATVAPNYVTGGVAYRRDLRTKFNNDSIGLNSDAFKLVGGNQRISYGLSANQVETSRPWTEVRTRLSDNIVTQAGTKDRMPEMKTTKLAAYVNDEITFTLAGHRASLTPGLRFESQESKPEDLSRYVVSVPAVANEIKADTESYVTPSLAFNLGLTPALDVYATYRRGVRVPAPAEKTGTYDSFSYTGGTSGYAVLGNPDLKKETSNAFEVGLRGDAIPGVTFHVAAFYTKYEDYIEYAVQPFDLINYPTINQLLYRPENVGEAEIYGAEASARLDLGTWNSDLAGFNLHLEFGGMNSSATSNETGTKGKLGSVGPFKGSLTLAYDAPSKRFGVALTGTRIGGKTPPPDLMADSTAGKFAVPGVTLLDFTAYFHVNRSLAINAGIYNLTDEKYWDYYSARGLSNATTPANLAEIQRYVQPGINGFVSVSLSF